MSERRGADFDAFYSAHYDGVRRLLVVVLGDRETARDVTQEAFVKAFVHWRRISDYDNPLAWVRKVAVRLAIRTRSREERFRTFQPPEAAAPPSVSTEARLDLVAALADLSPLQRAAVALHYLEDLPVSEVSRTLNCSESTARVHLHRARHRLAAIFGEELEDVR